MKLAADFKLRAEEALRQVRSGGKDALRRFKTPTMAFPVSEGMSDGPTSTDLAAPGRLAAIKETVRPMDDPLFAQRRRVIDCLYDAKRVLGVDLPRVKVRIVDYDEAKTLGLCHIGKDHITVSGDVFNWSDEKLRHIVWHELAHAWFNAKHDPANPLMAPTYKEVPRSAMEQALRQAAGQTGAERLVAAKDEEWVQLPVEVSLDLHYGDSRNALRPDSQTKVKAWVGRNAEGEDVLMLTDSPLHMSHGQVPVKRILSGNAPIKISYPWSVGLTAVTNAADMMDAYAEVKRLRGVQAAKKDEGFGLLKMKNLLLFPNPVFAEKASVVENRDKVKEQKTPDATMPLDEKSIGTITFDTSKGSTMVSYLQPGDPNRKFEVWWESDDKVTYAPVAFTTYEEAEGWAAKKKLADRHNDWGIRDLEAENAERRERRAASKKRDTEEIEKAKAVLKRHNT
jgi:hypothetical protein